MINILLGTTGSGKSYEATVYHVLPALQRGRKVITNLPLDLEKFSAIDASYRDLIEIRTTVGRGLREDGTPSRSFASVEDYHDDWRHSDGFGPLFVIDECHFCLPKIGTSRAVTEWFSMHRHYNVDVLLISQSAAKLNMDIRDLVHICYKVRKSLAFGKDKEYIRRVFDGIRGSEIESSERKYKPEFFGLYKSHTQGVAVEEFKPDDVQPFIVRFKRYTWLVFALGIAILVYAWIIEKPKPKTVEPAWLKSSVEDYKKNPPPKDDVIIHAPGTNGSAPVESSSSLDGEIPEPYKTKGIHLTGRISMGDKTLYTFAVSQNGLEISNVTHRDLERAGYRWLPLTDCAGSLGWGKKLMAVTCDKPQVSMGMAGPPGRVGSEVRQAAPL